MMAFIPAADDPIEIQDTLWEGFGGNLAFEVGANIGRALPRMMHNFTKVIAFEPYVPSFNIVSQIPGADVRQVAVSDHDGTVTLRLHSDQLMSEGHEHFNRDNPVERLTVWEDKRVPCVKLDSVAAKEGYPDFINVDCEGHEIEVLQGASEIIAKSKPSWLIEFHSHKLYDGCVEILQSAGYEVETVRHPHYPYKSVNWYQHGWVRAHGKGSKMKIGLMLTAKNRPFYFEPTLLSWALADDINTLDALVIALGRSDQELEQRKLVKRFAPGARIWLDSDKATASNGMHRAIAESASRAFKALKLDFLIFGEEDVLVSSDIVHYMRWAAEKFREDPRVLVVNAHNKASTGWDPPEAPEDAAADQEAVRLLPYMNGWIWGTWADRWEKVLEPSWDYECNSGGAMDSGYDWNIATRIIPKGGYLGVVPDAARSQHNGKFGGWAASPDSFDRVQAKSFRDKRENVSYNLVEK